MDSSAMGSVAAASTSIDNGFEHYWKTIVDESERYEAAREDLAEAQEQMRGLADEGASAFDRAMQALAVPRPKLCPPGAWGCVDGACRCRGLGGDSGARRRHRGQ